MAWSGKVIPCCDFSSVEIQDEGVPSCGILQSRMPVISRSVMSQQAARRADDFSMYAREYLPDHDCERSRLGHGPTRPHVPPLGFNTTQYHPVQPPSAAFSSSPDSVTLLGRSMYLADVRSIRTATSVPRARPTVLGLIKLLEVSSSPYRLCLVRAKLGSE